MQQSDGSTLRQQLEVVWKNTGRKPKELEYTAIAEEFEELWGWFLRLNNKRSSNGWGVNPLAYSEIKAFFDLIQYQPHAWELELIEILDSVMLEVYSKEQARQDKANSKK